MVIEIFLYLILSIPLVILIHETGHAIFIKLFNGTIKEISFGQGNKIIKVGIFSIYKSNPLYGRVHFEIDNTTNYQQFFISSGGILLNLMTGTILWYFVHFDYLNNYIPVRGFIFYSYITAFYTAIPQYYKDGYYSDGKAIIDLLRRKKKNQSKR